VVRPRSREKDERILLAATTLFAEHGYPLVAVADIAARAGVGLSTLYLRFPSKEALGNAVYRHCKRAWARSTLDTVPADVPPAEQFHAYWDHLHRFARNHRDEATYAERRPTGFTLDADTTALLDELHARATRLVDSWTASSANPLRHEVVAALIHGTFWQIYSLPVPARRRSALLQQARDTIWTAIAGR
jgi:TetR/AcrR family transcriptional regulator, repressor of fatR-cypB operon